MNKFIIKKGMLMILVTIILCITTPLYAQSYKEVTMSVGETQTFYLPSSITSLNLKSVTFYSNGISYVQVTSYTNYSVTVKAVKAFSSPVIVRCDYRYYIRSGSYTYETSGAYDYRITVSSTEGGGPGVKPTSITFPSSVKALDVGESVQLSPTVLPANAEYTLTWSIKDKSVATVSQDGLLVGKASGAADLKVMADNGVYTMLRVVVSDPKPTSISVSPSAITIIEGQSTYLSATVYPSNACQSVSWSSSNSSVVSVNSTGKISALKSGVVTVTASTANGKTGSCIVTCKEAVQSIALSDKEGVRDLPAKANVTYERIFYPGWNSICAPFAINRSMLDEFCTSCKIATIAELEIVGSERILSLMEVQSVNAGEPCLVYVPQEVICKFNLKEAMLSQAPQNKDKIRGVYKQTTIGSNYYKLADDGKSLGLTRTDEAIVAPFRAYIRLDDIPQTKSSTTPVKIKVKQVIY